MSLFTLKSEVLKIGFVSRNGPSRVKILNYLGHNIIIPIYFISWKRDKIDTFRYEAKHDLTLQLGPSW